MKNRTMLAEIGISVILVLLLFVLLEPFGFYMPSQFVMTFITFFVVIFGIFVIFIWRENTSDERDVFHRMLASRAAFLTGSVFLVLGIVIGTINHDLNEWLVVTLVAMIIAKIVGRFYGESRH